MWYTVKKIEGLVGFRKFSLSFFKILQDVKNITKKSNRTFIQTFIAFFFFESFFFFKFIWYWNWNIDFYARNANRNTISFSVVSSFAAYVNKQISKNIRNTSNFILDRISSDISLKYEYWNEMINLWNYFLLLFYLKKKE